MNQLPLPIGYQRLNSFPIDDTQVFATEQDLDNYISNGATVYGGQLCVTKDTNTLWIVKSDLTGKINSSKNTQSEWGEF